MNTQTDLESAKKKLYGTWKLVSWVQETLANGETQPWFEPNPYGYITFTPDDRVIVLVVQSDRPKILDLTKITSDQEATLFKSMMSYAGSVEFVDAQNCNFHLDISWNENWTGAVIHRQFTIDGDTLTIVAGPQVGTDGQEVKATLVWRRVV